MKLFLLTLKVFQLRVFHPNECFYNCFTCTVFKIKLSINEIINFKLADAISISSFLKNNVFFFF